MTRTRSGNAFSAPKPSRGVCFDRKEIREAVAEDRLSDNSDFFFAPGGVTGCRASGGLVHELVAQALHSHDVLRIVRVGLDFLSYAFDVDVERLSVTNVVRSPDFIH